MRALVLVVLLAAPALAHNYRSKSCNRGYSHARGYSHGTRYYGHKHYGYRRFSYRAYRPSHVQRYRYLNRYYTGRSYLDHRAYGYGYGYAGGCGYGPTYPYGRFTRPYAALAPIYSRYGASLTLYDPIFERDQAKKAADKSDGDGLPQTRERRVGSRFLASR